MKMAQRYLALALALTVIGAVYLSVREVPLPEASRIDAAVAEGEPVQTATDQPAFTAGIEGFTYAITPRAAYDIAGLVVSHHRGDAWFNMYHAADPGNVEDVCVVWGEVIANGSYRKVRYSSGEFTCYYTWSGVLTPPFNPEKMSNNHVIPADSTIARRIRAIRTGDQIRMRGLLVDYTVSSGGREVFTRRTSLTRKDTGNGACEILYVTEVEVIRPSHHLDADAAAYAWYASLGVLVALGAVWVARPPTV
jgi:hypothetical protein